MQSVPEGLRAVEGLYAETVCEELQCVGSTHIGEVHGGLFPVEGALQPGKSVRSPSP